MNEQPKRKIPRWLPMLLLALLGTLGGFLWYRFFGCTTGNCAISSNPLLSTFYGGAIGTLLGYVFTPAKNK